VQRVVEVEQPHRSQSRCRPARQGLPP
jgi:hypothetical protein